MDVWAERGREGCAQLPSKDGFILWEDAELVASDRDTG